MLPLQSSSFTKSLVVSRLFLTSLNHFATKHYFFQKFPRLLSGFRITLPSTGNKTSTWYKSIFNSMFAIIYNAYYGNNVQCIHLIGKTLLIEKYKPILGDPGAVSRVKRKGSTKVFKYGRKSLWVPTLIELFPKIQADAGS